MTFKVAELEPGNGYNAETDTYGDLYADGVIDPVKVTRSALANAASIASLLLTTETLIVEKPEEEETARPATGILTDATREGSPPEGEAPSAFLAELSDNPLTVGPTQHGLSHRRRGTGGVCPPTAGLHLARPSAQHRD